MENMLDGRKVVVVGAGWLGKKFYNAIPGSVLSSARIEDKDTVASLLDHEQPDIVINAAGVKGNPNIDWCETFSMNGRITVKGNLTGPLRLSDACEARSIRLVHLSSGCIFNSDDPNRVFTEEDIPNPPSFYSMTKATADCMLRHSNTVLILRIRMPITAKKEPGNLITKLAQYPKVISVKNSVTVVDDFIAATLELIRKQCTGIYNMVNPQPVTHEEILELYKIYVDSGHRYTVIPLEELYSRNLAKAGRSNCVLSTKKLEREGIYMRPTLEAITDCLRLYKLSTLQGR